MYAPKRMTETRTYSIEKYKYVHPLTILQRDLKVIRRLLKQEGGRDFILKYLHDTHLMAFYKDEMRKDKECNYPIPQEPVYQHLITCLDEMGLLSQGLEGGRINKGNNGANEFMIYFIQSCITRGVIKVNKNEITERLAESSYTWDDSNSDPSLVPLMMIYNPTNPDSREFNKIRTLYNSMINGGWSYLNLRVTEESNVIEDLEVANEVLRELNPKSYHKMDKKFKRSQYESDTFENLNQNYFKVGFRDHMKGNVGLLNSVLWYIKRRNDKMFFGTMRDIVEYQCLTKMIDLA